jgi:2-polyprenyl-3-methyl-5-hydroxy-6-metoxy-1,4-benzoquinol methylase
VWHRECLPGGIEEDERQDKYDVITSTIVLEHISPDRYRDLISRCLDHLKPGGLLVAVEGYNEGDDMIQWFNSIME